MLPTLPFDIIIGILLMLPIESLVKFQNVCRAWRDLIRDPLVIKSHFHNLASKGNGYILYTPLVHADGRTFRLLCNQSFNHIQDIKVPIQLENIEFIVVGSCNGLLCLSDTDSYGISMYLCNPSIRKCRTINLPVTNIVRSPDKHHVNIALGFGYIDEIDDYKIIRIGFPCDEEVAANNVMRSKVEVYSMITDSWKSIEVDYFPWEVIETKSQAVVRESVHWKAVFRGTHEDALVILAFHMGEEVFRQIELPDYEVDGNDLMEQIGVFKGNLSLFVFHLVDQHPRFEQCYLWVMNEYGMENSWSKLYSIIVAAGVVSPIIFTNKDEIVFEDGESDVNACHLDSEAIRSLGVEAGGYLNFITYMDSLVMLEG